MKLIIPAYFYPGPIWDQLWQAPAGVIAQVIINPNSGPGSALNPDYVRVVRQCKKKGIGILGYVATTYGKKTLAAVMSEVNHYYDWYAPTGIFFDEVASAPELIDYYRTLYDVIPGLVVLNPGCVPDESYFEAGDIVVIFESKRKHAAAAAEFPEWLKPRLKRHRSKTCQIALECTAREMPATLKRIAKLSEYAYVTDDLEPNPYDKLPSYWTKLVKGRGQKSEVRGQRSEVRTSK